MLGDLDTILDYVEHHNPPRYLDAVVARLRAAEKRLREVAYSFPRPGLPVDAREMFERINGGPVSP